MSLRSLAATVLDLVHPDALHGFPGASLARTPSDEVAMIDTVLSEFEEENLRSVVDGQFHFIWRALETAELFDLDRDPMEVTDLAGSDSAKAMIERTRRGYAAHLLRGWKGGPRERAAAQPAGAKDDP